MRRFFPLCALLLVLCLGFSACQTAGKAPDAAKAPADGGSFNVSATATADDAKLADKPKEEAPAPLPADHWLAGTSDAPDMVPATIAAPAPRVLLREHGPAYLEQIGDERVLHLKGTHYDMGFQHGALMKDEIMEASAKILAVGNLSWKGNFQASLDEAWNRTSPFLPEKYKEEIRGMADATGLSVQQVQNFTIFPELFHCSGFALWGTATADGELLHGRVLDYMRSAGLDKYSLIIIQEPEGANAFVNVAYSGMIGSVTGMNDRQIGVGEMGGGGAEKWDGMPMTFLIRECLESGSVLDDVVRIMRDTARTCQYYYVISDAKAENGRGMAYGVAAETDGIQFIGPNEFHPQLPLPVEDAVLLSAGDRYRVLAERAKKMHGQFTPQLALDLMARGVSMTSNMHNALFKPKTMELWVANSTVRQPACNRAYRHYDIRALMASKPGK
ncbi:MAG: peptidase C45 [Candidatus Hydrogenedens sp.]|nr:peptidase C45 [Candidatus Hydrogenedentota bacterium]NLF57526.1 peptidase C45 [Candidatus Hydrogenedens sp.]